MTNNPVCRWLILGLVFTPAFLSAGLSLILLERGSILICGGFAFVGTLLITCLLQGLEFIRGRRVWALMTATGASLLLIISIMTTHWPVRAAFALAQPGLDRLASDVQAGRQPATPQRVGLFTIQSAEMTRAGVTCLWVDLDPAGRLGFVRCGPEERPVNVWSMLHLSSEWQLIAED